MIRTFHGKKKQTFRKIDIKIRLENSLRFIESRGVDSKAEIIFEHFGEVTEEIQYGNEMNRGKLFLKVFKYGHPLQILLIWVSDGLGIIVNFPDESTYLMISVMSKDEQLR